MRPYSSYQAWLIDLDGTLYHPLPVRALMAIELMTAGLPALPTIRAFRKNHEYLRHHPERIARDPYTEQLELTSKQLKLPLQLVERCVTEWMQQRPGKWLRLFKRSSLLQSIAGYRSAGGRTALVSDYPARIKLQALGAESSFDIVIAAGEPDGPKTLKPDPEGYLLAARALNIAPEECLVLGDRDDADGTAAQAAGMVFRLIS